MSFNSKIRNLFKNNTENKYITTSDSVDEDVLIARGASIKHEFAALGKSVAKLAESVKVQAENQKTIDFLMNEAETQGNQIQRYKDGYDEQILEKHLSRFIRISQNFTEEIQRLENTQRENNKDLDNRLADHPHKESKTENEGAIFDVLKSLKIFHELLKNALLESHVVAFKPNKGETSVTNEVEAIGFVFSSIQHSAGKIADVVAPGYKINDKILVKSKVKVYTDNREISNG